MRLPLLDYTKPFNASATLLLVMLLLWVGLKEKENNTNGCCYMFNVNFSCTNS